VPTHSSCLLVPQKWSAATWCQSAIHHEGIAGLELSLDGILQAMYLTRRAELAEAAALISPLELPSTMRSATAASIPPPILEEEVTARGRHTSAASLAGSTPPHVVSLVAGTARQPQCSSKHDETLRAVLCQH